MLEIWQWKCLIKWFLFLFGWSHQNIFILLIILWLSETWNNLNSKQKKFIHIRVEKLTLQSLRQQDEIAVSIFANILIAYDISIEVKETTTTKNIYQIKRVHSEQKDFFCTTKSKHFQWLTFIYLLWDFEISNKCLVLSYCCK